jgi:hypothetical protein
MTGVNQSPTSHNSSYQFRTPSSDFLLTNHSHQSLRRQEDLGSKRLLGILPLSIAPIHAMLISGVNPNDRRCEASTGSLSSSDAPHSTRYFSTVTVGRSLSAQHQTKIWNHVGKNFVLIILAVQRCRKLAAHTAYVTFSTCAIPSTSIVCTCTHNARIQESVESEVGGYKSP